MKKGNSSLAHPLTGDLLRSLFLSTSKTADAALRESFLTAVDHWLELHEDDEEVVGQCVQYLISAKGTALEPLVLTEQDIELAIRFARLAFIYGGMRTGSEEAILIGSRDAIGSGGGVYFKKQSAPEYIERYPYGKKTPVNERTWLFSPQYENEALSQVDGDFLNQTKEKLLWESGIFRVPGAGSPSLNWQYSMKLIDDLKRHSSIGRKSEGFGRFGLSVDVDRNDLIIKPDKPESMLRLSAMMAQNEVLILDPEGSPNGSRGALCVQLSEPADDGFEFPATVHSRSNPISSWVSLPVLLTHPEIKQEIVDGLLAEFSNAVN